MEQDTQEQKARTDGHRHFPGERVETPLHARLPNAWQNARALPPSIPPFVRYAPTHRTEPFPKRAANCEKVCSFSHSPNQEGFHRLLTHPIRDKDSIPE